MIGNDVGYRFTSLMSENHPAVNNHIQHLKERARQNLGLIRGLSVKLDRHAASLSDEEMEKFAFQNELALWLWKEWRNFPQEGPSHSAIRELLAFALEWRIAPVLTEQIFNLRSVPDSLFDCLTMASDETCAWFFEQYEVFCTSAQLPNVSLEESLIALFRQWPEGKVLHPLLERLATSSLKITVRGRAGERIERELPYCIYRPIFALEKSYQYRAEMKTAPVLSFAAYHYLVSCTYVGVSNSEMGDLLFELMELGCKRTHLVPVFREIVFRNIQFDLKACVSICTFCLQNGIERVAFLGCQRSIRDWKQHLVELINAAVPPPSGKEDFDFRVLRSRIWGVCSRISHTESALCDCMQRCLNFLEQLIDDRFWCEPHYQNESFVRVHQALEEACRTALNAMNSGTT